MDCRHPSMVAVSMCLKLTVYFYRRSSRTPIKTPVVTYMTLEGANCSRAPTSERSITDQPERNSDSFAHTQTSVGISCMCEHSYLHIDARARLKLTSSSRATKATALCWPLSRTKIASNRHAHGYAPGSLLIQRQSDKRWRRTTFARVYMFTNEAREVWRNKRAKETNHRPYLGVFH